MITDDDGHDHFLHQHQSAADETRLSINDAQKRSTRPPSYGIIITLEAKEAKTQARN